MAKGSSNGGKKAPAGKAKDEDTSSWSMDGIPDALRDAGKRAAELAQNPYARSLLAAGLVAAAAALASNKNVREATRRNLRTATEAAEAGAENVGKVGIAIVNAATEAVQRMMALAGTPDGDAAKPKRAPAKAKAATTRKPAAKPASAAKKPAAAKAAASPRKTTAKPAPAKAARKPAAKKA